MPATVTLSTTTLAAPISSSDTFIKLDSTSGLTPGMFLFIDGELLKVVSLGVDPWVTVVRGVGGCAARHHDLGETVYLGRGDQFYDSDPIGSPIAEILVSPYINVVNGSIWFAQGDPQPKGSNRWWQKQTTVYDVGALGVRTAVLTPTSST